MAKFDAEQDPLWQDLDWYVPSLLCSPAVLSPDL